MFSWWFCTGIRCLRLVIDTVSCPILEKNAEQWIQSLSRILSILYESFQCIMSLDCYNLSRIWKIEECDTSMGMVHSKTFLSRSSECYTDKSWSSNKWGTIYLYCWPLFGEPSLNGNCERWCFPVFPVSTKSDSINPEPCLPHFLFLLSICILGSKEWILG